MLHRMTTFLSTVVVAFLAAPVLNARFDRCSGCRNCLADRPTTRPRESVGIINEPRHRSEMLDY